MKCPDCGSTAQVKIRETICKTLLSDQEIMVSHICECGCGCRFIRSAVYTQALDENIIKIS